MKTQELLDKYKKTIAGLLSCKEEEIRFFITSSQYSVPAKLSVVLSTDRYKEVKEIEYFEPEKDDNGEETGNQIRYTRWNNWSEGSYLVYCGDALLASFQLYKMPHCCAILVSCKAYVSSVYRNKRVGTTLNTFRQDIGRALGYSLLMCTDINQNTHQRRLLATNGWKDIHSVQNKRTNNLVHISVINL